MESPPGAHSALAARLRTILLPTATLAPRGFIEEVPVVLENNEKAAIFIGWIPHAYDHVHWIWRDKFGSGAHDMGKPQNYMRALEAVCLRLSVDVAFGHEAQGHYCDIGDDNGTAQPCYTGYGANWGEAAVNALAALYDAEHQEKQCGVRKPLRRDLH